MQYVKIVITMSGNYIKKITRVYSRREITIKMDKSAMIRGAILAMQVENKVKTELFEYLDEIEEKASMYDGLCD